MNQLLIVIGILVSPLIFVSLLVGGILCLTGVLQGVYGAWNNVFGCPQNRSFGHLQKVVAFWRNSTHIEGMAKGIAAGFVFGVPAVLAGIITLSTVLFTRHPVFMMGGGILVGSVLGIVALISFGRMAEQDIWGSGVIAGGVVYSGLVILSALVLFALEKEAPSLQILFMLIGGIVVGGEVGGLVYAIPRRSVFARRIEHYLSSVLTSPLSHLRFTMILCGHCLQYTSPPQSRYSNGERFCEHCDKQVTRTPVVGEVIVSFGNVEDNPFKQKPDMEERTFILSNADFAEKQTPIDVSTVYIDTETCDTRLLEYFITFLHQHSPRRGLQSVHIYHKGSLHQLGEHLHNTLRNTFTYLQRI